MSALILANGEIRDEIIKAGARMLRNGSPAPDVAEYIAREVEDDPNEFSVGTAGMPNILGEVELDAAFMEGATRRVGAVAAVKGYRHPISIARQVMERLPHVFLAGDGAMRFAEEIKAERANLLTDESLALWRERINIAAPGVGSVASLPDLIGFTRQVISMHTDTLKKEIESHDTMNVIVRDERGRIFVAVTTSGIAWKYPGRVGDSPVAGAGFYADDRYGAGACMGLGEWTIRHGTTLRAILAMAAGQSMAQAGAEVLQDMHKLASDSDAGVFFQEGHRPWVRLLLMDAQGNCGGFSTKSGLSYKVQRADEDKPQEFESKLVI